MKIQETQSTKRNGRAGKRAAGLLSGVIRWRRIARSNILPVPLTIIQWKDDTYIHGKAKKSFLEN